MIIVPARSENGVPLRTIPSKFVFAQNSWSSRPARTVRGLSRCLPPDSRRPAGAGRRVKRTSDLKSSLRRAPPLRVQRQGAGPLRPRRKRINPRRQQGAPVAGAQIRPVRSTAPAMAAQPAEVRVKSVFSRAVIGPTDAPLGATSAEPVPADVRRPEIPVNRIAPVDRYRPTGHHRVSPRRAEDRLGPSRLANRAPEQRNRSRPLRKSRTGPAKRALPAG